MNISYLRDRKLLVKTLTYNPKGNYPKRLQKYTIKLNYSLAKNTSLSNTRKKKIKTVKFFFQNRLSCTKSARGVMKICTDHLLICNVGTLRCHVCDDRLIPC